ncbi:hypothetical protein AAFC00_001188 [Neodothiora populina]|uniref:Pleckstrin homology domain-containing protein n=1 Tax=Neodothiora populina TaxID=2781224 RepID=A0ABR3PN38_9PEZI
MTTDYFSDYRSVTSSRSLTSSADTPYETSPLPRSRRSMRRSVSRESSSSPPPLPSDARGSDAGVFKMDPKRFTPTLHASLVSEILTLRRELESKHRFIDNLEVNLDSVKTENESLSEKLAQSAKDARLADQRFKTLEDGTLDAVEDLARERDAAKQMNRDLKSRIETLNRTIKSQEEQSVKSQQSWQKEKQSWENERRQLETRIHVTEGRLRTVVEEMTSQRTAAEEDLSDRASERGSSTFKDSGLGNDSDTGSVSSHKTIRHGRNPSNFSIASVAPSLDSPKKSIVSTSLADELGFDEEDDDYDLDESDHDDDELLSDIRLGASPGHRSMVMAGSKAKKILGLTNESRDKRTSGEFKRRTIADVFRSSTTSLSSLSGSTSGSTIYRDRRSSPSPTRYVDSAVQSSRPSSLLDFPVQTDHSTSSMPKSQNQSPAKRTLTEIESTDSLRYDAPDVEKRASLSDKMFRQNIAPLSPPETPILQRDPAHDDNDTPRGTTVSQRDPAHDSKDTPRSTPTYTCTSTQTDYVIPTPFANPLALRRNAPVEDLPIPSISIHPPLSTPTSPSQPVLPPGMVNASAQTEPAAVASTSDAAVQTEGIRIDTRPVKLAPHLLPSTLDTAMQIVAEEIAASKRPEIRGPPSLAEGTPRRNMEKLRLKALDLPRPVLLPVEIDDQKFREDPTAYSDGSVFTKYKHSRESSDGNFTSWRDSLPAPERNASDVEAEDDAAMPPVLARYSSRTGLNSLPKTVPEDREISPNHAQFASVTTGRSNNHPRRGSDGSSYGSRPMSSRGRSSSTLSSRSKFGLPSRSPSPTRGSTSNGASTHSGGTQPPPFPIPSRSSSRARASTSPNSPTPHETRASSLRQSDHEGSLVRSKSLRKAHSSNTLRSSVRVSPIRRRRRNPQLTPIQSMAFDSTPDFNIPDNHTAPSETMIYSPVTEEERTEAMDGPDRESVSDENDQEGAIVDAIAATMVGEWLWKYVRRRKSFVLGDTTPGDDGTHGVTRHKRWVWLSPYERTIMWSTKQPNSGSALMGKNGRKLTIKSVLDVKDEKPLSKTSASDVVFDRSILILTPERALKFTAPNSDRHYLWLTALSFLAQSGRGPPGVPRLPPPELAESLPPKPRRPTMAPSKRRDSEARNAQAADPTAATLQITPVLGEPFQPRPSHHAIPPPTPKDAAEAPVIPRMEIHRLQHQRKRSNSNPIQTAPFVQPSMRSFSSNHIMSPTGSDLARVSTTTSSINQLSSGRSGSRRPSASPEGPNFFEAVDTVRMDAFVDANYHEGVLYLPTPPAPVLARAKRRGGSVASTSVSPEESASHDGSNGAGKDPFLGF